ncbi:hypothetical protein [Kosmotoga pacifica]|uniref:Uncharacterized protein n=1 Tax=Kosmotoga pacifica TaxID=1330330 RepID=A0A0G2ZAR3_9BACT|nr:hypothetical protein [Kosmotoga pacifica]AKI97186.1 hypothetical protein IX53_04465 [Kosmotoga pacifica]
MKKFFVLLFLVLSITHLMAALEIYVGQGTNGIEKLVIEKGKVCISKSKLDFVDGGIRAGSYLFLGMKNFGLSILNRETLETLNIVNIKHVTDVAINIEHLDLFIADGSREILHYKFFRPDFLKFVEYIPTNGWVVDIETWHDYLVVATNKFGLSLFKKKGLYFEKVDKFGGYTLTGAPDEFSPSEIVVVGGKIFVAAGINGLIVLKIQDNSLILEERVGIGYAISLDTFGDILAVADFKDRRVLLFDISGRLRFLRQVNLCEKPRKIKLLDDPWTGELFLVVINDSGLYLNNLKTGDVIEVAGKFLGIVKPRFYEP